MKEQFYDALLNIKTGAGKKGFQKSAHYHRYEPTPYSALIELFAHYQLKSKDRIVDFGCGKGRLNFYINYLFDATVIGIEMNKSFFQESIENRNRFLRKIKKEKDQIHFHCCLAEEYPIDPLDNRFYFFNPFSIQVFMNIVNNILLSVEKSKRDIEIVLYYPSEDYVYFLDSYTSFELKKEVVIPDLYSSNSNERFLIYGLAY
ncbi:class I SAM-dependent methyltransferase [Bacillus solitudinis]|uniref:class I SAM-dependent methyltransferase n=1 Tax=Bacillus solitudinis TaxID=2014074 RepID=UPI000C241441|nr:methyltransferase [Bacillus solitudinis]